MNSNDRLKRLFPRLQTEKFQITSPETIKYNCIAYAAGVDDSWWTPYAWDESDYYWPNGVPHDVSIDAFVMAFQYLDYGKCESEDYEQGFEKIALFAKDGMPTHAARQINPTTWSSKIGELEDISHRLHDLEGHEYGFVTVILKRKL